MFKAAKNLEKYIGGGMCKWRKGDTIFLDRETIVQNFEQGDYEAETIDDYTPFGLDDSKKKSKK